MSSNEPPSSNGNHKNNNNEKKKKNNNIKGNLHHCRHNVIFLSVISNNLTAGVISV